MSFHLRLSVPGKTFLVGEYLALRGGPSLILCTEPRFYLDIKYLDPATDQYQLMEPRTALPFAPQSPAGRLLHARGCNPRNYQMRFFDPHDGQGGLGASSAQFALLYAAFNRKLLDSVPCEHSSSGEGVAVALAEHSIAPTLAPTSKTIWDFKDLLRVYRECAWDGEGTPPSGADVVAQICGGITEFDGHASRAHVWSWPFEDLGFTLVRTGRKLATHEHLRQARQIDEESLRPVVEAAKTALHECQREDLITAVQAYGKTLKRSGLLSSLTAELLAYMQSSGPANGFRILAAKGCGAMGADVALLLHERADRGALNAWLIAEGLVICGDETKLSAGLRILRH